MKYICIIFLFLLSSDVFAQHGGASDKSPTLLSRQVSGIIKDTSGQAIAGALILLKSKTDSLKTITNEDGVFIFRNVKNATFFITVSGFNLQTTIRKYLNNDLIPKIVLDPIILEPETHMLNEVKISGTPTIKFKKDTIEFRASDYRVRENATVDELLKKMEGVEVSADGSLSYLGQQVTRAKLNGKDFAGGNVAQAIQNLPADIVEKAQIVDDYGDLAAKTGIKNGPMEKILNLTTKNERSIGAYGSLDAKVGNDSRYNLKLAVLHLNANQEITFLGKLDDLVNGIATNNTGTKTGLPGTTRSASPSISYRDQWKKNVQVLGSYNYAFFNNNSINTSFGQKYSFGENDSVKNVSHFNNQNTTNRRGVSHKASFQIDYDLDKSDFVQVKPTFAYSSFSMATNGTTDQINHFTTGFEHPVIKSITDNVNSASTFGIDASYQHVFKKPKRTFSVNININQSTSKSIGDIFTNYNYYQDSTKSLSLKDSTAHLLTNRTNNSNDYTVATTYAEPLGGYALLQLTGSINKSANRTKAISDSVYVDPATHQTSVRQLYRLDDIFNYSFTEIRFGFNFAHEGPKVSLSAGIGALPTTLSGTKINNNNGQNIVTPSRDDFRLIPILRFSYSFTQTEHIALIYTGSYTPPDFYKIQPFIDRSDPNNIIVGNQNLKATFTHTVVLNYNKYIPNSKISFGLNLNGSEYRDQVITNTIQIPELIASGPERYKTVNETYFLNSNGSKSFSSNYNLSKQLGDRRYYLTLNGTVSYDYSEALSNNVAYHTTGWRFSERLGTSITPTDKVFINPYVAYDVYSTNTSLPGATATSLKTTSLAIDGRLYLLKSWNVNFSGTKSFVAGLENLNSNPLVINLGFERTFLQKRNLILSFNGYDLLHQNHFIQQLVSPQGVTNTLSNTKSRYFLVGVRFIFQKWSGTPTRRGKKLQRRGDGSFIYN
ncbi:MAG: outer membrane beta-barrel protein [Mucilaginibacter sp.]